LANRRMFSLSVIDTDRFLEMPPSTQALYFHLAMRADDDGFISSPQKITKMINCGDDDLKILFTKEFVIPFNSGVCVIRDWLINNQIRKDRYTPTIHQEERATIGIKNNIYRPIDHDVIQGAYRMATDGIPNGNQMTPQYSIGKDSIVKDSIGDILPGAADADTGPTEPAVVNLMLNDKSLYPVTQSQIDHWSELYPAVDVKQELLKMQGWLESNPNRRKTKRGINAFITSWLSREQDKGRTIAHGDTQTGSVSKKKSRYDFEALEKSAREALMSYGNATN